MLDTRQRHWEQEQPKLLRRQNLQNCAVPALSGQLAAGRGQPVTELLQLLLGLQSWAVSGGYGLQHVGAICSAHRGFKLRPTLASCIESLKGWP